MELSLSDGVERVRCNLCGQDCPRPLLTKFGYDVVKCRNCSLVYVNPRPSRDVVWQRYGDRYFAEEYLPAQGDPALSCLRHQTVLRELEPYRQLNRLLDVGCATGLFLLAARKAGWEEFGLELSAYAAGYAREKLGLNVKQGELAQARFPRTFFDIVTLWDTLEHLFEPMVSLVQIREFLRPGGAIAISTPNLDSISFKLVGEAWSVISPAEHLFYFTRETLAGSLVAAGFQNIRVRVNPGIDPRKVHDLGRWRARVGCSLAAVASRMPAALLTRWQLGDTLFAVAET